MSQKIAKKGAQKTHYKEVAPTDFSSSKVTPPAYYLLFISTFTTFTFNVTNFELTLTAARRFPSRCHGNTFDEQGVPFYW